MKKFYVYEIYNSIVDKKYIGSRTISKEIDILTGYFTSSKTVKGLIKKHGVDSFEILSIKEFNSANEAIQAENELLQAIPKDQRCNYLNVNFSAGGSVIVSQTHHRIHNPETGEYVYHPKSLPIPDGWIKKTRSIPPSRKGLKKCINVDTLEISVLKYDECTDEKIILYSEYLKTLPKPKKPNPNMWITNGEKCARIFDTDVIPDGWYKGKLQRITKHNITNGIDVKYVDKNLPIPDGWYRGDNRNYNTTGDKVSITNGLERKFINHGDSIPDGWWKGTSSSSNTFYILGDKVFFTQKEIVKHLNTTKAKFEWALSKGRYNEITVMSKEEYLKWSSNNG